MINPLGAVAYMLGAVAVYVTGLASLVVLHLVASGAGIAARLIVLSAVFLVAAPVVGGLAVPRLEQWAAIQQQHDEQAGEQTGDDR